LRSKLKDTKNIILPQVLMVDNQKIPDTEILIKIDGDIKWRKEFGDTEAEICAEETVNMIETLFLECIK
jgi:phage/plasmid primase-like uncharacterized protein